MSNLIEKKCIYCGRSIMVKPDREPICAVCNMNPDKKTIEEYARDIVGIVENTAMRDDVEQGDVMTEVSELLHELLEQK